MFSAAGRTGFDPVVRRRVYRLTARLRPLLLPVALVTAALIVGSELASGDDIDPVAAPIPIAPAGRVLVVVSPADPAVLRLTEPGTVVDVYGAAPDVIGSLPEGAESDQPARALLLASSALVMGPTSTSEAAGTALQPAGVLGGQVADALTLAVTDSEASAIAARRGSGLSLALRPGSQSTAGASLESD